METRFFLPILPPTVTHQEQQVRVVHRGGKAVPQFYEPQELKNARAKLLHHLEPYAPDKPMEGALRLVVKWCFPLDRGGRHRDGEPKASRPDTDNLEKLLKDCMTAARFWKDDAQVASEICEKFWAERPGIFIQVTEWEGEP
ncbi:MAG: RusA family crossover junction endodeoxyribonuclease [Clostridiales bacterium]|nr:RusA family crossover junction endodeoxyribonuclease [Clostridiales bacterium]